MKYIYLILFLTINFHIYSTELGTETGFKIPRYVSLKSNEANLRVGPSLNFPINIQYNTENFPLEIVSEYELWREIVDIYGNKGWIHKSLLKGERYGIINSENKITEVFNYPNGKNIGEIGNNNIVKLKKCLSDWCLIIINRKKGWVNKKNIWGVYKSEIYNVDFFQPLINLSWKLSSIKFFK